MPLQRRFDKKHILITCSWCLMIMGVTMVSLRLLDVLPENGDPVLTGLLVGHSIGIAFFGATALIMFVSMVADTLDVQELETGLRQEGVFNAAVAFSAKATSGFGILISGILIETIIKLPEQVAVHAVPADVVFRLGVIDGLIVPLFNFAWMLFILKYGITRARHAEVMLELEARRQRLDT